MRPYGDIAKTILLGIGIASVVVVVAAAPGVVVAAKLFEQNKYNGFSIKKDKQKAVRAMKRLEQKKLLSVKQKNGKFVYKLTKEGQRLFEGIRHQEKELLKLRIQKPAHWDGKWRILIFDVPDNSHRQARDILRSKLKQWEFYPLQKSVWVCPWPCEKELRLAASLYNISRYINVIIAEKISDDTLLKKHFGL